jgi:hypothetical protein
MALTLRPTGLESPVYNDLKDYTVFSGRWGIGRIYEERGARPDLRWYWTLYGPHAGLDIIRRDGRASTLGDLEQCPLSAISALAERAVAALVPKGVSNRGPF